MTKTQLKATGTWPRRGAEEFHRHLSALGFEKDVRLADLGAGTGLVGQHLHSFGYQNLTVLDFSDDMLQQAPQKKAYRYLICIDLNWDINDIPSKTGMSIPALMEQ